jgi:hypothetical protein
MRLFPAFAGLSFVGLFLAGCSLGADPAPMAELDTVTVPNIVVLAPRIQGTFGAVKLTGSPRVSPARRAPVSALGDWIVCLRSDAESEPRIYALIIQNNDIIDYRLALGIDGCANDRYEPLPSPPAPPAPPAPASKRPALSKK